MDNDLEKRTLRKISWRIVPFIMLLYFVAYIDRVNIGFASLTMRTDLGVTASILGFGAGIFFWGYFLFEVPSNIALHKVGARLWIARVMVTWGIISACMAFVKGPTSFYIVRFLLGAAEAGFFPGIILYLSSGLYPQIRSFVLPEDAVHLRNLVQSEKAAPHNGWPRWTIMLAREVTAEFCDP
jgi:ACS family tartrate transporter-like MFS transporter